MRWTVFLLLLLPAVTAQSQNVQVSILDLPVEVDANGTAVVPFRVQLATTGGACAMPSTLSVSLALDVQAPDNVTVSTQLIPKGLQFTVPGQTLTSGYQASQEATLAVTAPPGSNVTITISASPAGSGCLGVQQVSLQGSSATSTLSWAPATDGADAAPQQSVPGFGIIALLCALTVAFRLGARLK